LGGNLQKTRKNRAWQKGLKEKTALKINMKLIFPNGITKENPSITDIKSAMAQAKPVGAEFIHLEKDAKTVIQAFYVKDKKDMQLLGADYSQEWYVEKSESRNERYYLNVSTNEAINIFVGFLNGEDWKKLAKWVFIKEKERWIALTNEEKKALLAKIDAVIDNIHEDWKQILVQWKKEIAEKGALSENWNSMLPIFLESSEDTNLKSIVSKFKR